MDINENNFSFNEPVAPRPVMRASSLETGAFAGFLIKKGLVKNATQANIVLLLAAIVCFASAGFIFAKTFDIGVDRGNGELPKNISNTYEK